MPDLNITVDGKDYAVPDITAGDWRKVLKANQKIREKYGDAADSLFAEEGIDAAIEFYHALLGPHYPELTKNKLEKMPMHQLTGAFVARVFAALGEIPLGSAPPSESESAEKEKTED
jgi:hypothetical protein